jgi:hypothetical protein
MVMRAGNGNIRCDSIVDDPLHGGERDGRGLDDIATDRPDLNDNVLEQNAFPRKGVL